jgi:hypothetical protein
MDYRSSSLLVTGASNGTMSAVDKIKLDGLDSWTEIYTELIGGSGTVAVLTYSPAVSTQTELVVKLRIHAGMGGKCIGAISAIVTRGTSGAPTVQQTISGNWLNTYAGFNPEFVVSGNDILLQVTAHSSNATFVRSSIAVDIEDISADVDPLDVLYLQTLAIVTSNGGFLWHAGDVTESGGYVTAITDQAGNYTITRRVGDNGAVVGTLGGNPAIDFEATGLTARYQIARTAGASTSQKASLFVVWAPETSSDSILFNCDDSPVRSLCPNYVASLGSVGPAIAGSGATYTSAATDATPQILEYVFGASTKYVLRDGTITGTAAAYTPANLGLNFSINHDTTELDGKIPEMILLEDEATSGERVTIMSYLQTKYAGVF